jgi:hypothetical protein
MEGPLSKVVNRYATKIDSIRRGLYQTGDFIIADAKDADLSGGIRATGPRRDADGARIGWRSRPEFLASIEKIVTDDVIDVMLVSASNLQELERAGLFKDSAVQPAFRANDTTDIWGGIRHGSYGSAPSYPFRSADLPLVGCRERLALYSITFNNSLDHDLRSLQAFATFRSEARARQQRYFLEVFNPNVECGITTADMPAYVNDCVLRTLAGLAREERPEFLKITFNGAEALEELSRYDPGLVIGLLGGGAGTTRDAFELIAQGERHGARVALFGRKINFSEDETLMIRFLRKVADREFTPAEAVRAYHEALHVTGKRPDRSLDEDLIISSDRLRQSA